MSGRPKAGIDYAGWSVSIFDGDTKIDKLLDAQGWIGFGIYFYLCQMAYKFDGYFYRWAYDDSASTARRMGGGIGSGTVEETVRYCLQIGLFDKGLFDRVGILTSRGIQRRFYAAIQGRRVKSVISEYWLLDEEESKGLDKCTSNTDFQRENTHLQLADGHLQLADDPKSKVKESKVSISPTITSYKGEDSSPRAQYQPVWFERFWDYYPRHEKRVDAIIEWDKLKPSRKLCEDMKKAIRLQSKTEKWQKSGGKYIPCADAWLRGRRWEDEVPRIDQPENSDRSFDLDEIRELMEKNSGGDGG